MIGSASRIAAALGLLAAGAPAAGYVRTTDPQSGKPLYWATRDVTWTLSTYHPPYGCANLADAQALVRQAFAQWAAATRPGEAGPCTDFAFAEAPATPVFSVGFDGANRVVFRWRLCSEAAPPGAPCLADGTCDDIYDCWDDALGASALAITVVTYSPSNGRIVDADILFHDWNGSTASPTGFWFTCLPQAWTGTASVCGDPPYGQTGCASADVGNTVTHEAGHVLGFDHNPADPASTMYPTAPPGDLEKRTLTADDADGMCAVYPPLPPPKHGGCGCGAGPAGAAALLPLLALRLRRPPPPRRRPRSSGRR